MYTKSAVAVAEAEENEALSRHQRKCLICRHPDREDIEDDFLHWGNVWNLAQHYDIEDYRSIYRHARAFGLIERRRENFRSALDRIIENASDATVTGDTIIRAIRACSCLDNEGRWAEPPKQVVFTIVKTTAPCATTTTATSSPQTVAPKIGDQPAPSPPQPPDPVRPTPSAAAAAVPIPETDPEPPLEDSRRTHLPPPSSPFSPVEQRPPALAAATASTPVLSSLPPPTLIYGTGIRNHAISLKT